MLSDEVANENDILSGNNSAPIAPRFWHLLPSMANRKLERKSRLQIFFGGLQAHLAPDRRRFGVRIPGRQQQLGLVRTQRFRRLPTGRPPPETPL
jgi:hypothetical protein